MKLKMNALDVKASVAEMHNSVVGLRLINIYDVNGKLFLFKFGHGEHKRVVLVESGVRMHLTNLIREKPKMPSQFTFKLRKHIKSWRLEKIEQWANDRTVVMRFGSEQTCFYIIVELYAKGNVILADNDFMIMMLLRTHKDGDVKYSVKEKYVLPAAPVDSAAVVTVSSEVTEENEAAHVRMYTERLLDEASKRLTEAKGEQSLREVLTAVDSFGPQLAQHAILISGLSSDLKKSKWPPLDVLVKQLEPGLLASYRLLRQSLPEGGFLIRATASIPQPENSNAGPSPPTPTDDSTTTATATVQQQQQLTAVKYEDFSPILLQQFSAQPGQFQILGRAKFSDVADEYFCYFEMEKIDTHNTKKQAAAGSPVERLQREHIRRIKALESEIDKNAHKGYLLQMNEKDVQDAIDLINSLLARGMNWDQLKTLLRERRADGHPIAQMIHTVHLERNSITVLLEEELDDETEDNDIEPICVEVDLSMSAQRNAGKYFTQKKSVNQKLEKTLAATDKALAGASRKGAKQAAKAGPQKREVFARRKEFWFEKFFWFVSSGGNICLSGRDKQQTDLLIQRYMRDGDIFVHSDANNAFPYLVKGKPKAPIPRISVMEAGAMVVNRSACWTSKGAASAWWVYASQVTKGSAGSGCYLNPGMFLVKGERTYMKPLPLSFGVTLLFRVSAPRAGDASLAVSESAMMDLIPAEEIPSRHSSGESALSDPPSPSHPSHMSTTENTSSQPDQAEHGSSHSSSQRRQGRGVSLRALPGRSARGSATATSGSLPESSDDGVRSSQRSSSSAQAAQAIANRRAKTKMKKINKKYAEQDEEDVARAMTLNGNPVSKVHQELLQKRSAASVKDTESTRSAGKAAAVSLSAAALQGDHSSGDPSRQTTEEPVEGDDGDEGEGGDDDPSSSHHARIVRFASQDHTVDTCEPVDKAHDALARKQQQMQEEYDRATLLMEEDIELALFTGEPSEEDTILFCIPMVSTWARVRGRRYALEITTGHDKKGHAAGNILAQFQRVAERLPHIGDAEKRAIPLVSVEDLTNQLPPNLKLHVTSKPTGNEAQGKGCAPRHEAIMPKEHFVDPVA